MKLIMINGKIYKAGSNLKKIEKAKKFRKFVELCSKSVTLDDLKIGSILYDVNAILEITSKPYVSKNSGSIFIKMNKKYCYKDINQFILYNDRMSLADHNIIGGGYNLERVFKSKELAIEYKKIRQEYEYFGTDSYGEKGLQYKVKPIPGQKLNPKKHVFELEK